ncbi:hypothetical protein [Luteitalea sp.]|uniref:hypothetical protein n=1 Tax=Luteitalea sp. TaxID=2004800 RepID=UPI0025BF33F9|nr:hypothetical protein [Luteitalea sp.]
MARTPAQWQALARTLARDADALNRRFVEALVDVLRRVERRLPSLLADAEAGQATAALTAARLGRTRTSLRQLLAEAGYDDLATVAASAAVSRTLRRLGLTSAAYRRALAFETAGRPAAMAALLTALRETARLDILGHGDVVATALWRATVRGTLGAEPPAALLSQLAAVLDGEQGRAATLYDTNVSIVQRLSVQAVPSVPGDTATDRGAPLYVFVGPVDEVIRPFCLRHVGRVYTRAEIDALDNGQLPNTFVTGGGYNCRHLWAPISRFDPAAALQGTDGRVAEVAAELARRPARVAGRRVRRAV